MRVLVTGAAGFVGPWVVRALRERGHEVVGAIRPGDSPRALPADLPILSLELGDGASVRQVAEERCDAVVHLAAVASGAEALRDPRTAWEVNAVGTAVLAEAFGARRRTRGDDPIFLLVSTAEVYGAGPERPRVEEDPVRPCSPYAASKAGAEMAVEEVGRRTGLRVIVVRPFAHTGPGQDERFVIPAFVRRLRAAEAAGAPAIKVGNLDPVREFLHVDDVARAYVALLEGGDPGEVYNVASGEGVTLGEVLGRLMGMVGHRVVPEGDARLARSTDILYLVGDGTKLRRATGWAPRYTLDDTLRAVVDAETH